MLVAGCWLWFLVVVLLVGRLDDTACPGSEGTPDIVYKDAASGYYYVTFHGWDPAAVQSARGVAKTRDFVNWVTADGGVSLSGDALFTSIDCDKWNVPWVGGACVGGGEGTIMVTPDGYLNMVIEAADASLGCLTTPQHWVIGLVRAPSFQVPVPLIPRALVCCISVNK